MRPGSFTLIADAWRLWRADWSALTAIAGFFLFLAEFGRRLILMPELQAILARHKPDFFVLLEVQSKWMVTVNPVWGTSPFPWLLLAAAFTYFGTFVVFAFYLDRERVDVRGALRRGLVWLVPYVAAMIIVSALAGLGLFVLIIGFFYATARLCLVGPVMAAERDMNPLSAIGRSLQLTRGHSLMLTALMIVVWSAGIVAQLPFAVLDEVDVTGPVTRTIVALAASTVTTAATLAMALVQVAVYRRLGPV